MSDSIVDLGAAGEYISEKFDDVVDYFTGAPKARASDTYIVKKSRKGQTLYSGKDPRKETFAEFFGFSGFEDGGVVELGEGSPISMATEEEIKEFLKFLRRNRPSFKEGETEEYRIYSDLLEPTPHNPNVKIERDGRIIQMPPIPPSFAGQSMGREEFYEGLADPASGITEKDIESGVASLADLQDSASLGDPFAGREGRFVPRQIEIEDGKVTTKPIGFDEGGEIPEAGIGSFMYDVVTGNVPSDQYNAMRTSGRMDDPMAQAIYGQDPTFMEQLVKDYNYPANIPMQDEQGYAIMDPETGKQKMMMATDFNLPEYMRTGRPRPDMPTYGELEDARAHALASALMAKDYGPETTGIATKLKEAVDMLPLSASNIRDMKMDNRNNALGVKLLKEAGVNATPKQLARIVDQEVFKQLDRILGRTEDRQKTPAKDQPFAKQYFKSPEGGLDVYFPRDKEGYFDTSYIYD